MTTLERDGQPIPEPVRQAERLTRFAVFTRYPGVEPVISETEYREGIASAEAVVEWVARQLSGDFDSRRA